MIGIAGDVGGTKTLLSAAELAGGKSRTLHEERYPSSQFPRFADMLRDFLGKLAAPARFAALGVAGPVIDGRCHATNLPWTLDERELASELGLSRVLLLNDFAAAAQGCLMLKPGEFVTLQEGKPHPNGPAGVLGAGTGLGEAMLFFMDGHHHVIPSEGGHGDFAPRTDEEVELLAFLRARFGRVSWERILSGPGIRNLYDFVKARARSPESAAVADAMQSGEVAAVVTQYDVQGDPLCRQAMDLFVSIYGAEAGNVALRAVASRGVYVAGGVAPRIVPRFQDGRFMEAFGDKGRYGALLKDVPVYLVTETRVGLIGALDAARRLAEKEKP